MLSVYVICWIFLQTFQTYFCIQANSVDPDQTAPRGADWSGSTLFAKMTFKNTSRWQSRWQLLRMAVLGLRHLLHILRTKVHYISKLLFAKYDMCRVSITVVTYLLAHEVSVFSVSPEVERTIFLNLSNNIMKLYFQTRKAQLILWGK